MARRQRDEGIFDLLTILPWWASVVFAGVVYVALRYWLPGYWAGNPCLVGIATGLQQNAGLFALFFLLPAPVSIFRSIHRLRLLDRQSSLATILPGLWWVNGIAHGQAWRELGRTVLGMFELSQVPGDCSGAIAVASMQRSGIEDLNI